MRAYTIKYKVGIYYKVQMNFNQLTPGHVELLKQKGYRDPIIQNCNHFIASGPSVTHGVNILSTQVEKSNAQQLLSYQDMTVICTLHS